MHPNTDAHVTATYFISGQSQTILRSIKCHILITSCVNAHLHHRCALPAQFVLARLDSTSLCLHSGKQTDSGMFARPTDFQYGKLCGQVLAKCMRVTLLQVRQVGYQSWRPFTHTCFSLYKVLAMLSFVVIRTIHF